MARKPKKPKYEIDTREAAEVVRAVLDEDDEYADAILLALARRCVCTECGRDVWTAEQIKAAREGAAKLGAILGVDLKSAQDRALDAFGDAARYFDRCLRGKAGKCVTHLIRYDDCRDRYIQAFNDCRALMVAPYTGTEDELREELVQAAFMQRMMGGPKARARVDAAIEAFRRNR